LVRVEKLLNMARALPSAVLVGSSLGGHVSTAASIELRARGLFLMAPAFYMPGFERYTPKPAACPVSIVHGWNDEIVPVANSIRYAGEHQATLQLIDADHRMLQHIAVIRAYFELFLNQLN
jgi:alpha/beta superfamily hydrolase